MSEITEETVRQLIVGILNEQGVAVESESDVPTLNVIGSDESYSIPTVIDSENGQYRFVKIPLGVLASDLAGRISPASISSAIESAVNGKLTVGAESKTTNVAGLSQAIAGYLKQNELNSNGSPTGSMLLFATHSDGVIVDEDGVRHTLTWKLAQMETNYDSFVTGGSYNSTSQKIELKHGSNVVSEIDASDFIKDGMISSVTVSGGYLIITFNTDAGKSPIRIPLSSFFDSSLYYTKTQIDSALSNKQDTINDLSTIRSNANGALQEITQTQFNEIFD